MPLDREVMQSLFRIRAILNRPNFDKAEILEIIDGLLQWKPGHDAPVESVLVTPFPIQNRATDSETDAAAEPSQAPSSHPKML